MFNNSSAYQDDWDPNADASSKKKEEGPDPENERIKDFHEFDGAKAKVPETMAKKYEGIDFNKEPERKKPDNFSDLDKLADEILGKQEEKKENSYVKPEPDHKTVEIEKEDSPASQEKNDDKPDDLELKPKEEREEKHEKHEPRSEKDEERDTLEKLLKSKATTAIQKLDRQKEEKGKAKAKLEEEIKNIDEKKKELISLEEELRDKLKKFDSQLDLAA